MAYYNEYDIIQVKNTDGTPAMPRTTPKSVVFPDGKTLEEKWDSHGGTDVTMEDNADKTIRFSVDGISKDVASNVNLMELQNHVEQGYTSDPNVIAGQRYDAKTGNLINYGRACCSRQKYAFGPGVAITMNTDGSAEYTGYCEYDSDGNFLRGHSSWRNPSTWTTGDNCALVAFNFDGYTNYTGRATYVDEIGQTIEIIKVDLGTYHKGLNDKADKLELSSKQDLLVSGTNIKTINNQSIIGSGNIDIDTIAYENIESVVEGYDFYLKNYDLASTYVDTNMKVFTEENYSKPFEFELEFTQYQTRSSASYIFCIGDGTNSSPLLYAIDRDYVNYSRIRIAQLTSTDATTGYKNLTDTYWDGVVVPDTYRITVTRDADKSYFVTCYKNGTLYTQNANSPGFVWNNKQVASTPAGMTNTNGGSILIGVGYSGATSYTNPVTKMHINYAKFRWL